MNNSELPSGDITESTVQFCIAAFDLSKWDRQYRWLRMTNFGEERESVGGRDYSNNHDQIGPGYRCRGSRDRRIAEGTSFPQKNGI